MEAFEKNNIEDLVIDFFKRKVKFLEIIELEERLEGVQQ